jgi:RNA polymerase sigma factor (TIGR02999 family)
MLTVDEPLDAQLVEILSRVRAGDSSASNEFAQTTYAELHRIAQRHLRKERPDHTLQPTALVNEAYLRFFGGANQQVADRAHFMAVASRIMRSILVDHARARASSKRGGNDRRITLDLRLQPAQEESRQQDHFVSLLDLNLAIDALALEAPLPAQAIEMRYFGGMTAEEISEAVDRSINVVQHELRFAYAWLRRRLVQTPE